MHIYVEPIRPNLIYLRYQRKHERNHQMTPTCKKSLAVPTGIVTHAKCPSLTYKSCDALPLRTLRNFPLQVQLLNAIYRWLS